MSKKAFAEQRSAVLESLLFEFQNPRLLPMIRCFPEEQQKEFLEQRRELYRGTETSLDRVLAGDTDEDSLSALTMEPEFRGRITLLCYLSQIAPSAFRQVLDTAWIMSHRDVTRAAYNRQRLRAMFRYAAFPIPEHLPEVVRIYRGTSYLPIRLAVRGPAWTTDRDIACWFAMRFAGKNCNPLLLAADVPRANILFYPTVRGEDEVVCFNSETPWIDGIEEDWQEGHDRKRAARLAA